MAKKIKMVVFDIAGTTVKDGGEITLAFQTAMKEFGYEIPAEKIYPLMGYKKTSAIKFMLKEYEPYAGRINEEYINAIHERFVELMVAYYSNSDQLQPLPNALEIFEWLRKNDIKIGLDTGFPNDITDVIMDRLGWLKNGRVDYVVSSNQVPAGRPNPFMIQRMMNDAGIEDSKEVIKIGDTEVDVNEGKNAGCIYSIAVTTGAFTHEQLLPFAPDFIIDDLNELVAIIENANT